MSRKSDVGRRIVCAAIRTGEGRIILGVRHFDKLMAHEYLRGDFSPAHDEQGFVDNRGQFITRQEALVIAREAGQILRAVGGDHAALYSENLY